jgi:putative intracellular protease/amidase
MARVLFLLPALDFDPSEAAVSWQVLVNAGHVARFATPDGRPAVADDMMLTGRGLDLWGQIPLLRNLPLLGLLMRANRDARQAHAKMIVDPNYVAPQRWDAIDPMAFDALLLPGGHRARGMRNYLESDILQWLVAHLFDEEKPVAAICHGVLRAASFDSLRLRYPLSVLGSGRISRQIANALNYVGVVAVEIFVVQGNGGPKVLVNEIRCRCTIPDTGRSTARRSRRSSNTSAPSPASR